MVTEWPHQPSADSGWTVRPLLSIHEGESTGFAAVYGDPALLTTAHPKGPLTRMHSRCFYGDVLGSLECDCGPQLYLAQLRIQSEGSGLLLYLNQEGRGLGSANKARIYALMKARGINTYEACEQLGLPADVRNYDSAVRRIGALGITELRLLSNNPAKRKWLEAGGITANIESHATGAAPDNFEYLESKREAGHELPEHDELMERAQQGTRAGGLRWVLGEGWQE